MSEGPLLEASALVKRFGSQGILGGVNLTVKRGESYVILGRSGSGKSVLLKTLAGLLRPDSGFVRIGTARLGMLFQNGALFDSMTVEENLLFPLRSRLGVTGMEARREASALLDAVGLPGSEKLMPASLSGGMQKRLGIARALIVKPDLIFYDEPTAGLDPITSRLIVDLIVKLRDDTGSTVVAATSDVLRAYQMAHRMGLLVPGAQGAQLMEIGSPADAKSSADPAVMQFLKGLAQGPLTTPETEQAPQHIDDYIVEFDRDPF